jgi:hypothetical protein
VTGRVLLVAALLVLTGCSGAPAPGASDRVPETTTATPAPVPDLTPTATRTIPPVGGPTVTAEGELAPGVTAEGVVDAIGLGSAHRLALTDRNLTVERVVLVKYPNGTVVRLDERVAVSAERDRLYWTSRVGNRSVERWSEGVVLTREVREGTVTYAGERRRGGTHALEEAYRRSFLSLLVTADEARVTRVGEDGPTGADYRLTATTDSLREAGSPFGLDPEPGTVSLYVRADGLVVGWDLAYTAREFRGTPVAVRTTVRHVAVGATPVERPPWYGEALATTGLGGPAATVASDRTTETATSG